ncbi:hypothetical protein KQI68_07275 [Peptoniphilus sp. MSJ-1]|uniref:Uncharacterized protein n=1 Tax=Peptoniphilus ovalis TaxID=2841503 RepID=A0ABS6FHJ3_9FIRM|nr:hypothetical protein [Peptoniphilus ovalis]MBU5669640.1 hypothetical protein [Peptoniphilus ovalis]
MKAKIGYNFEQDELMQQIGKELFKNGNIAESNSVGGNKVISYLIEEETVYRPYQDRITPKNATLVIYPEFNQLKECYDIITVVTIYTNYRNNSNDFILSGDTKKNKEQQIKYLEAVLNNKTVYEIWIKGTYSTYVNCVAPVSKVEIPRRDLAEKIINWNKHDLKICKICGKKLARYSKTDICKDCHSKETIINNRL